MNKTVRRRRAAQAARLTLAAWLCAAFLACQATPASARQLRIRDFHVELDVLPNASLDVTETIRAEFIGAWNGLYRTIPVEYPGPRGFNYSLFLRDVHASDDDGGSALLRIEQRRRGGVLEVKIYVPGANDATRTISLHYTVQNGLRFFEDHDELYWNVTGNDWDVPIESASAHITVPEGVSGLRAANYTGAYGSRAHDAGVNVLGSNVEIASDQPLALHEGLTVAVAWDKGFVHEPGAGELTAQFFESNWPLGLPVVAFATMFWLWYTRGRDPRVGAIAVQYEPPAGLSPGEMGTLVDDQAGMRDITATLVDLAVRGFIVIEERAKSHLMGLYSNKEYVFHSKKKCTEWAGLKSHELLLLAGFFANGGLEEVTLSQLQNKFYKNLPGIRSAIFDSLVEHGYYAHRPDQVRQGYLAAGAILGFALFFGGQYFVTHAGMQFLPFLIAALLTTLVVLGFGWFMPARTTAGARALHDTLGFEDFLGRVEGDRLQRMTPTTETFEKYLPFAMALGVEKKWAAAFDGIFTQPPAWYQGPPGIMFHPVGFVSSMDEMSVQAGHAMASAPRSSGGSGFGGGGGSGGGFGGGGGGGF